MWPLTIHMRHCNDRRRTISYWRKGVLVWRCLWELEMVLQIERRKVVVLWHDLDYLARHSPESLILDGVIPPPVDVSPRSFTNKLETAHSATMRQQKPR